MLFNYPTIPNNIASHTSEKVCNAGLDNSLLIVLPIAPSGGQPPANPPATQPPGLSTLEAVMSDTSGGANNPKNTISLLYREPALPAFASAGSFVNPLRGSARPRSTSSAVSSPLMPRSVLAGLGRGEGEDAGINTYQKHSCQDTRGNSIYQKHDFETGIIP